MKIAESKKVVLLVDDVPANIRMVTAMLKDDYEIRFATNGAMALDLVKTIPAPDLILLDVMMPGMNGYEVCTRLKTDPETRDIPVIFVTGETEVSDESRGFKVGAVDYIHKPFSEAIVQARVHTHLTLQGVRQQLAQQLRTLKNELETARRVQLSILPREIPEIEGLDIAARYLPMASVAGDFYDFIVVDEKRIGMLVADVSGHGMPAALIASMLKIALGAQCAHASEPAQVLFGLNQTLCGKFYEHYVTAAYVFINMEDKTLKYAGAGHPPLLLCDGSTGSSRGVEQNGLVLGCFPGETYSQVELPLAARDWVVLFTDGISETRNPLKEQFGYDRIKQSLEDHSSASAAEFANELLCEASRWTERPAGEGPDDDVTILAVHVDGPGKR
jgi:sigma-B regulation protein RsbU (phosphoserine phosphatase)